MSNKSTDPTTSSDTQNGGGPGGLEKGLSNLSKESTMSIPGGIEVSTTAISLDENIFDDAKRALAPSGGGSGGLIAADGGVKHVSPHMVNIHQFYPEIDFSLDKGTVGEIVVTPKSTSRSDLGMQRSLRDLKDSVIEEETEGESAATSPTKDGPPYNEFQQQRSETDLVTESSFTLSEPTASAMKRNRKAQKYHDSDSDEDDDDQNDEDDEEIFSTQVDEGTLTAAKKRQAKQRKGGGLFYPESWGPTETRLWTLDEIVSEKAENHFQAGVASLAQKKYEKAITHINKAVNLKPKVMEYFTTRAECFLNLCDFQSAILNYKKACVLDPDNSQFYNRLAFIYYFQGQCLFDQKLFPEALEAFSRAAEMRPEVVGYHMRSIACLAALQRHGECLALVNKRLEQEHDNADLYVMRARLHQLFRNTTLCYYDIKDALSLDPEHIEALKLMEDLEARAEDYKKQANSLNLMGRHRDALQKISIAIETNPSIAEFHVTRGALHRRVGDYNAAIDDYLLALDKTDHNEEHPVYVESQRQLLLTYNDFAVECFVKGFFEEAIILLNKAIKGEKREKGLYVNRGDCFFKEGNMQFSLADYHQALELDETDPVIRARIAVIHNEFGVQDYQDKNYKEADKRFTMAIQHNPKNAKYYLSRARTRHLLEQLTACRQDVLMSVHLDPSNPEIPSLLARFFQGKNIKDIMGSKLAEQARQQLQNLVMTAGPVKLSPLSISTSGRWTEETRESEESEDSQGEDQDGVQQSQPTSIPPSVATWKPGGPLPNFKACMEEKEFNIKIAEERKELNHKVKDALINRKPLTYKGTRMMAMPNPASLPTMKSKFAVKPPHNKKSSYGWKTFGLSGGGTA